MRRTLVMASLAAAAWSAGWAADRDYADTHPPAGVARRESAGATQFEASVPGRLLDWVLRERAGERPELYLLGTIEDDPDGRRGLYRVDLGAPALIPLAVDLAPEFDRLTALDTDGDRTTELLLGRPGAIFEARGLDGPGPPEWVLLASAPGLDLGADVPIRGANHPPSSRPSPGELLAPGVGVLRRFGPDGAGGWGLAASWPLAVDASRHHRGLRLTSPPTTLLRLATDDLFAVGPRAVGSRRLLSTLLPPTGEAREAWSRLPSQEALQSSSFHVLDGRPVLVVTTNSADEIGVLERRQLHLFSLYGDRTHAGIGPWLSRQTTSRRWQRVEPYVLDVDGDGDDDLVVVQLDGLGGGKTRIEAFLNTGRRGFEARPRISTLEREASGWHFGADLTGDGLGDLVLLAEGTLEVYPTLAGGASRLLDRRPRWSVAGSDIPRVERSVTLGAGGVAVMDEEPRRLGDPVVLDVDGDGRSEILLVENPQWGFGRLRIVFLADR